MSLQSEHEQIRNDGNTYGKAQRISGKENPMDAIAQLLPLSPVEACALLDCMSTGAAGFYILLLRGMAYTGNNEAKVITERADALNLRAVNGLRGAGDQIGQILQAIPQ